MRKICQINLVIALFFSTDLTAQLPNQAEDISPLLIGESVPDLPVIGIDSKEVSLYDIISEKPTVLIFYRGGWCPYCNLHLGEIGSKEPEILELGYQVVAISPDNAENLRETAGKEEVNYRLFSDASGELTRAIGIAFQAPERYGQRLLDRSSGKNMGFLPVPSVFVLNMQGEALFEYINPDYKKRLSGDLLLAVLKALRAEGE
jgi:peroxiredoxin